MSASAAVSASSAALHAPSSQFSGALKRSRFGSFDPAIRQAYGAPAAHAHRGNYGLKKPINLKRRNAYISLAAPFESRAEYIEWNSAESQVRFIKRFEEMQITPKISTSSPWNKVLGSKNRMNWLMDSEFCYREEGPEAEEYRRSVDLAEEPAVEENLDAEAAPVSDASSPATVDLNTLGMHGARLVRTGPTQVAPNIYAMSNRAFEKYLVKLRELRPAFREHIAEIANKRNGQAPSRLAGKSLYELAQSSTANHHRVFLGQHTVNSFRDPSSRTIEPQPHRNGGLQYSHLSKLHTHLYAKYNPGIVLHAFDARINAHKHSPNHKKNPSSYSVSYGGIVGKLSGSAKDVGVGPLLDLQTDNGLVGRENLDSAVVPMRIESSSLIRTPRVVGRKAQGLKAVTMNNTMELEQSGLHGTRIKELGSAPYAGLAPGEQYVEAPFSDFAEEDIGGEDDFEGSDASTLAPPREKVGWANLLQTPSDKLQRKKQSASLLAVLQSAVTPRSQDNGSDL